MRKFIVVGILLIVITVCSLTGAGYFWQQGLDSVGHILGFMAFLTVLLAVVVMGIAYGVSRGLQRFDEYVRDVASASIQVARETAEETVENIPETLIGGIEKSMKKARDRFFGERMYTPPWKRRTPSPRDELQPPRSGTTPKPEKPEPKSRSEDKTDIYRKMIDDAIDQFRDSRKPPPN